MEGNSRGSVSGKEKDRDKAKCSKCEILVKDKDPAIQCEICEIWSHARCEGISEEGYKVMKLENVHWFCSGCNKGVGKILATLAKVQHRQDMLENELSKVQERCRNCHEYMKKEMEDMHKELSVQRQEISQNRDCMEEMSISWKQENEKLGDVNVQEARWSDIVSKHVEKKLETVQVEMKEVQKTVLEARSHIDEEKEKEKRKNNIIIYRYPENESVSAEVRRKVDLNFCYTLFKDVLEVDVNLTDIQSAVRLGKKEGPSPRPLLIVFKEGGLKNEVMESLGKLADAEDIYKKLSISHDLTQRERGECKDLVEEAKQKELQDTSGEWIYRVRGIPSEMRIVRLKKRSSQPGAAAASNQ